MLSPTKADMLLHLERYPECHGGKVIKNYNPPYETTALGVSKAIKKTEAHSQRMLKELREQGLIDSVQAYPKPSGRNAKRCSCYFLTDAGREAARQVRIMLKANEIIERQAVPA
jgi:DNA-binding MarR family transcriptional regulator